MSTIFRVKSFIVCLAGMVLLSSTAAYSQVTTADVVGTVTDVTGASIAGVKSHNYQFRYRPTPERANESKRRLYV